MTLARLGTTSLFLGVWTPLVALAIVWAAAGSGTPIVFALEQAGVDQIDRTAVALVFAPPLPYLFALGALAIGLAAQRLTPDTRRAFEVRRAALRLWIAAGVMLSAAAPLSLYAEHGTSHEPADNVHLALGVATWIWWSTTATAITVAVALRTQVALTSWTSRSRYVAGTSVGIGVLSLGVASVAVAPRPAREALGELATPIDVVATGTESVVLALAGGSADSTTTTGGHAGGVVGSDDDDHYTEPECLEALGNLPEDSGIAALRKTFHSVDVTEIASDTGIEICAKKPRRGHLGGMFYKATKDNVISRVRYLETARRRETDVIALLSNRSDAFVQREESDFLACIMRGLSETDRMFLWMVLLERRTDEVAASKRMSRDAVVKATYRARMRAKGRAAECGGLR